MQSEDAASRGFPDSFGVSGVTRFLPFCNFEEEEEEEVTIFKQNVPSEKSARERKQVTTTTVQWSS